MGKKEKLPVSENSPEDYIIPLLAQAVAAARSFGLDMQAHFIEMAILQATDDKAERLRTAKASLEKRNVSTQPDRNRE